VLVAHNVQTDYTFWAIVWYDAYHNSYVCPLVGEGKIVVAKVIEHAQARYDIQEVPFGRVYKWHPESVLIDCECGERTFLTASMYTCEECGAEHAGLVRENLTERRRLEDEDLRPWRYSGDREGAEELAY
jgi:hypothetical protein